MKDKTGTSPTWGGVKCDWGLGTRPPPFLRWVAAPPLWRALLRSRVGSGRTASPPFVSGQARPPRFRKIHSAPRKTASQASNPHGSRSAMSYRASVSLRSR